MELEGGAEWGNCRTSVITIDTESVVTDRFTETVTIMLQGDKSGSELQ